MKRLVCILMIAMCPLWAEAATKFAITGTAMNSTANTWGQVVTGASYTTKVLTPASSPGWTINALAGLYVEIRTTTAVLCTVASNTASTLTVNETGPANGTARYILFNEAPPGNGDTCSLNGATVAMVATPFPSTGTFLALDTNNTAASPTTTAGQITIALDTLGNCAVTATNFYQGRSATGVINVTSTTSNTFALTGALNDTVYSGVTANLLYFNSTGFWTYSGTVNGCVSNTSSHCINNVSTGTGTGTGAILAGSAFGAHAVVNSAGGTINWSGDTTGGTSASQSTYALSNSATGTINYSNGTATGGSLGCFALNNGGGTFTLTNVNFGVSANSWPYGGKPATWNNAGNANTITIANTGRSNVWVTQIPAGSVVSGIVEGASTGTRTDCPAASALSTARYGGDGTSISGTFVPYGIFKGRVFRDDIVTSE